ncbi:ovostatin [Musca domestica]|uniref:Ovostatin n=1 Tax=Musca domestica TaxID=7370 RepID=A0ABM3UQV6_MUSDO|nr:ovostatin [Musca domestica]
MVLIVLRQRASDAAAMDFIQIATTSADTDIYFTNLNEKVRYYSVVAPGTIKSNRNYSVCLTLHNATESAVMRVSLVAEPLFNYVQMSTKLDASFDYELLVEGVKGLIFRNSTKLQSESDNDLKIYIQTDKAVYKPGDVVHFRVVVLNEHLKPFKSIEPIQVEVMDGNSNRIKQFKDIKLNTGVYTNKLNVSEQPVLGNWLIRASVLGKYQKQSVKNFKVEKYVLPKFGVYIDADSDIVLADNDEFSLAVYGKYTFGKYVEGHATILLLNPATNKTMIEQKAKLENYTALFKFKYSDLPEAQNLSAIKVLATLEESHTAISQSVLKIFNFRTQKYEILIPQNEIEFSNGRPYKIKVIVQHWNGSRVHDTTTPLTMSLGEIMYETYLNGKGEGTFTIDHMEEESFIFQYANSSQYLPNIVIGHNGGINDATTACTLKLKNSSLKFDTNVDLELKSDLPIPYLIYTVTGHGDIVRRQLIKLPDNTTSHTIKIKPSMEMVPLSFVYVHYIVKGQLRYCEQYLKFPNEFENKISVSAPPAAKPGEEVELTIKTKTNSYVALLAIDLGAQLLGPDYDIDRQHIFHDLMLDLSYSVWDVIQPGFISGLRTLTNAAYEYEIPVDVSRKQGLMAKTGVSFERDIEVRTHFPETWIFMDLQNVNETTQLTLNVPDTITTWLITAFSVNDDIGFGMVAKSTDIIVFKKFFISTSLPYSIKRGEVVKISMVIFNYHNEVLDTLTTMISSDGDYDFIDESTMQPKGISENSKQTNVPANGGTTLYFFIKPKKLGALKIHIKATNHLFNDAITQELLVEPTGTIENHNKNVLINLMEIEEIFLSSIDIDIPENIVPDTEYLQLSVASDILHTPLDNLESLVLLPTGCGEQKMVQFAPNVLVLDHLRATGKYSENPDLVKKAIGYIEIGYQEELSYRHSNGGFSVFGPTAQSEESTWLTAYIIRFFIKAQRYTGIENRIIRSGLDFLKSQQLSSGEFHYTGYLFSPAHQDRYGFTAFVLMTFLESSEFRRKYKTVIQNGVNYLVDNINNINDSYALALVAVALQMSKNEHANEVLTKLEQKSHTEDGLMWWQSSNPAHSNDVEITAYALMALLERNSMDNINIFQWILQQRNKVGGFRSTHDTVVALQALIRYNEKYPSTNETLLKINYEAVDAQRLKIANGMFGIDPSNSEIWQQVVLPKATRLLELKIEGKGNALLQLAYHYYIPLETELKNIESYDIKENNTPPDRPLSIANRIALPQQLKSFSISPLAKMSSVTAMELEVCFQFNPSDKLKYRQSNMVIMEINMPSGFIASPESVEDLLSLEVVARVELENSNTKCLVYFKHLLADDNEEKCLTIRSVKTHEVLLLQPASITMYDYYIPEYRDTVAYQIQS